MGFFFFYFPLKKFCCLELNPYICIKAINNKIMAKKTIKTEVDIDAALGNGARQAYLEENPHGYKGVNKVHKNKKKYNRKSKHKKKWS